MAEGVQDLMTDETQTKTGDKTVGSLWKLPKRKSAARRSGVERLRQAVDKRVGKNSEKLADVLTEKALGGSLAGTKVLVELAEGKKPEMKRKKRGWISYVERLASEPEWSEPEGEGRD
jgi:hypothetical protein